MEHTAKNFVVQLGALAALYLSLSALISICFGAINLMFPDEAVGYYQYESAQNQIRFGIALLIVFFPTYITLTRMVNQARRGAQGAYLALTKWLIYLSLLVGGGILLGDLVAVILAYLNGEVTTRFILKALVLLVVIGTAFSYYIFDARLYWNTHESRSKMFGAAAAAIVIAVLVFGFYTADSPAEVRALRLDEEQVRDLENIQWRVEEYYRINDALPSSLAELYSDGLKTPEAPNGREAYTYRALNGTSFELCATFERESSGSQNYRSVAPIAEKAIANPYNWEHGTGRTCFERVIQTP